jgi:hypothetical protein
LRQKFLVPDRHVLFVPEQERLMSIYATLWVLKFPDDGDARPDCGWVTVVAQGVPAHIGSPTPGHGYEDGDPYADFLPPAVEAPMDDGDEDGPVVGALRAVVFIIDGTEKGTARSGQEYVDPLLVLSGEEYAAIPFTDLHDRLSAALRDRSQT